MNDIQTWQQGRFIDKLSYSNMTEDWKERQRTREARLVRPGPEENAICMTDDPEKAKWIAQRLNLASRLEKMTYDYATGKTDGSELVDFVRRSAS